MTSSNSKQTASFPSLAKAQTQTATEKGQGLLVLLYYFSRNMAILIHVYISSNLAAASALRAKIH